MDNVLFLTEAGTGIGFGHLMRSLALQSFFSRKNIDTLFFLNCMGNEYTNHNESIEVIDWLKDLSKVKESANVYNIVVVDSYLANRDYYSFLKTIFKRVIAIDDYNRIVYDVDLIINPNIFGDFLDYSNQFAKIISGKNYIILRDSFLDIEQNFIVRENIQKILVTLGGSDYKNILPDILNVIKDMNYKINIVTGSENYKRKLKNTYTENNLTFYGYVDGHKMVRLMLNSDIVISAAGQTLNELAYMGVPTISICIDEDQILNLEAYYKNGFLLDKIFWRDTDIFKKLVDLLCKMQDENLRLDLSTKGKKLVDGKGVENIYKYILYKI